MSRLNQIRGVLMRGFPLIVAAVVLGLPFAFTNHAMAQMTVESLTSSAVSEVGPYYTDVEEAITRFFNRDVEGARNLLSNAKKKTPKLAPPEVMLAAMFSATGQNPAARQELERAIKNFADDPEAYLILADSDLNESRFTEAGLLYAKASTLAEKFSENPKRKENFQSRALSGMAQVEEVRENWSSAKESLSAWVKLDPDSGVARQRLARVLFQLGDKKGAYTELQAAVKADSKLPPAEVTMGSFYAQSGDKTQAEKFYSAAAKKGANDLATNLALVQWNLQNSQPKEAETFADAALKADPNSLDAKVARGVVARMRKDYGNAKKWMESAHTQAPSNAIVTNHLALALLEQKDTADQKRAIEFAELNQKLNPNNPEAVATLGWIYYRMGRKAEGQRALVAVLQAGNSAAETNYYWAYMLKDQGKTNDALKPLEAALNNDRPFPYRQEAEALLSELRKKPRDRSTKEKDTLEPDVK